jgi:hypothetical protein
MATAVPSYSNEVRGQTLRGLTYRAIVDFPGDDYATGGIPIFLRNKVASTKNPTFAYFRGKSGYTYEYDYENDKLIIRQSSAAGNPESELAAAALPAGVLNDVIRVEAEFPKFG